MDNHKYLYPLIITIVLLVLFYIFYGSDKPRIEDRNIRTVDKSVDNSYKPVTCYKSLEDGNVVEVECKG